MNPKKSNRFTRRMMQKVVLVAGATAIGLATAAGTPALADAPDALSNPPAAATAAPAGAPGAGTASGGTGETGTGAGPTTRANRLIANGVSPDGRITVPVNKTVLITTTQPYKQVSVGQPDVADVNMINPNNILVTAKKSGTTQLIVWDDADRTQIADITVTMDVAGLQGDMNAMFPGSTIKVTPMNGGIALQGQVPDLATAEKANTIAQPYSQKVMNLLEVGGGQQVMLQVRFAEVSRSAANELGINLSGTVANPGNFSVTAGSTPGTVGSPTAPAAGSINASAVFGSVALDAALSALRNNNLARVLAEPNLTAISGQEGSFLAGGEFPIPVPQAGLGGGSTITIDYREFGVRLRFIPIVLGDGRVRLKLTPEVSELDFSSPLTIEGSRIPIVNKRTVTTTVELADGQTFAIAGLLNQTVNASRNATPLLGDIPVIGALFRSTRYARRETELVVLVTPRLVEPMNPNQVPPVPGEQWRHPNEAKLFINGDLGDEMAPRARGTVPGTPPANGPQGATGSPRYRGAYGFTPPPRATTAGSSE